MRIAIEDELGAGLPAPYSEEQFRAKCNVVFEHVFESYQGEGMSLYAGAA